MLKKDKNNLLFTPLPSFESTCSLIMKENEWGDYHAWYEVLHGWTRSQRPQRTIAWNHALPLIDLLSSIEVLGSRACQLASLLISQRCGGLSERTGVAQISQLVANQSASVATERCLERVSKNSSVKKKDCQHLHSVASFVKHKINMFLIYKKEQIKHHRSNGKIKAT